MAYCNRFKKENNKIVLEDIPQILDTPPDIHVENVSMVPKLANVILCLSLRYPNSVS